MTEMETIKTTHEGGAPSPHSLILVRAILAAVLLAAGIWLLGHQSAHGEETIVDITTNDLPVESATGTTTYDYDEMDFEGGKCFCQRLAFRAAQAFLAASGTTAINSDTHTIVTRWNSHGAEELFVHEFGWPEERVIYPPDLTPGAHLTLADTVYYFVPAEGEKAWKVQATADAFPEGFFEKRTELKTAATPEEREAAREAFMPLKQQANANFSTLPLNDYFTVVEIDRSDLTFAAWSGQWISTHTLLDDPTMQAAYETIASMTPLHTVECVQIFLETMYQTDFTALDVDGDQVRYTLDSGATLQCTYEEQGKTPLYWGGEQAGWWYQFETDTPECAAFKYLVATAVHAHGDSAPHWHLRYGDSSFDDLINDPHHAMWWPTATTADVTAEALRDETIEEADLYLTMLPNWSGQWASVHTLLDDPAMQAAYETIASMTPLHTAESVEDFVKAMYRSDFTAMDISENIFTYTLNSGETLQCTYDEQGIAAAGGPHGGWWYLYHTSEAGCEQVTNLIATRVHGHGGMSHWHLRYGSVSLDDLVSNPSYARWGVTAVAHETTAEQFAQDAIDEAAIYAMMLPPPLAGWSGEEGAQWISTHTLLDDSAMDVAYTTIAEAAGSNYSPDDVKQAMEIMLQTSFSAIDVGDSTITFTPDPAGDPFTCEYRSVGQENVTWGESAFVWHKRETISTDTACTAYTAIVATDVHHHGDSAPHWHLRYGDSSFDGLMNDPYHATWWPSLVAAETTAQQFADELASEADEMAAMVRFIQKEPSGNGKTSLYLPLVKR